MDYIADNWGSFVSLAGLVVSFGGLWWAIVRAGQARTSAQESRDAAAAAQKASEETQNAIKRTLTIVDLQKAIALVDRLKLLHRDSKWEMSLGHYQTLRAMLADIESSYPDTTEDVSIVLREAVLQISVMENNVDRALQENSTPSAARNFNPQLNLIQVELERIVSSSHFTENQGIG